ncbi:hypothetical protein IW261DRAFT_1612212 [Armillaria novae-zelandiae]|uniref:DUF6534 domain-containing protein n=1 Tax=Armillaria novae-zelandiae TaxID=153914 RepID=A0AA39NSU9_9AGAR|nr:hypothetical protein IW261DRAFT_1612212 [Armillaria novae-zelandiae]
MSYHLPSLGKTLGAVYIGAMLSSILLGITALQAVIYYKKFPHDPWYYRYSVAALWMLDMLHVALNTHAIYFYLIDSFGDYLALDSSPVGVLRFSSFVVLLGLASSDGSAILTAPGFDQCSSLSSAFKHSTQCDCGNLVIIFTVLYLGLLYKLSHISSLPTISKTVDGTFATSTSVDFIISGAMFYYLHKSTTITQFESTITLILSLMRVVVISGLATSACSLLALMTFVTLPNTLVFFAIGFILPKLYINSLLAMLNARDKNVKDYHSGGAPQVLQLTSENDSDIGMMERGVGTSLSDTPGVTPHEKF